MSKSCVDGPSGKPSPVGDDLSIFMATAMASETKCSETSDKGNGSKSPTFDKVPSLPTSSIDGSSFVSDSTMSPDPSSLSFMSLVEAKGKTDGCQTTLLSDELIASDVPSAGDPMVAQAQSADGNRSSINDSKGSSTGRPPVSEIVGSGSGNVSSLTSSQGREGLPDALPLRGGRVPGSVSGLSVLVEQSGEESLTTNHTINPSPSKIGDVGNAVRMMKEHPDSHEVQVRCWGLISQSLWEHGVRVVFNDEKIGGEILDQVVGAFRRHISCSDIPKEALHILNKANVVFVSRQVSKLAKDASREVVKAAVRAMSRNDPNDPCDPFVQANGNLALSTAARVDGLTWSVTSQSVPLIVSSMRRHPSHAHVVEDACLALSRLIGNPETLLVGNCQVRVAGSGNRNISNFVYENGISLILNAMQDHDSSSDIQGSCCSILAMVVKCQNYLVDQDLRRRVIFHVIEAMCNNCFRTHHEARTNGWATLVMLATSDGENIRMIVDNMKVIPELRSAMQLSNTMLASKTIRLLLFRIAAHISNCAGLVVDAIASDLRKPACSLEIKESLSLLLRTIEPQVMDPWREIVVKAESVNALVELLQSGWVSEEACTVLCCLAQNSSLSRNVIVTITSKRMKQRLRSYGYQRYSLYLLGVLLPPHVNTPKGSLYAFAYRLWSHP